MGNEETPIIKLESPESLDDWQVAVDVLVPQEPENPWQEFHDRVIDLRDAICIPVLDKMTVGLNWLNRKLQKYERR